MPWRPRWVILAGAAVSLIFSIEDGYLAMRTTMETTATVPTPAAGPARLAQPSWRLVLTLALPVLAQQVLTLVVGLSDRFLAGHYQPVPPAQQAEALRDQLFSIGQVGGDFAQGAGPLAAVAAEFPLESARQVMSRQAAVLAAQNTATYMAWFVTSYLVLVTVGSTALVARLIGSGDRLGAICATHQSLVLAALLGLLGTAAGLALDRPLVALLQLHGQAAEYAVDYLRPQFALLAFQAVEAAGIACLVGAGDTVTGFGVLSGVVLLNLPLSWGLCFGLGPFPEMGFVGISLGTALAHVAGCLAVLVVLGRGRYGLALGPRLLRPQPHLQYRLLRISIPAGVDSLSIIVGQLWFLSVVNRLGDVASSAHGIAIGWEALGYLSGGAFGTAAMTLVGQSLGAGRPHQAARSGWMALGMGCIVMSLMGLVFFTFARPMFRLFCPHPWQAPIIEEGVPVLRLVSFFMPALASCIVLTSALRGAGDTRVPVLFTWLGIFGVRVPLALLLSLPIVDLGPLGTWPGMDLGLQGAWLAMCADLMVRGLFFLLRFAGGAWQGVQV
jgi:putative MATE family efflux protein